MNTQRTELENMEYVQHKMDNEGFDYCFRSYSKFKDVNDPIFHELRQNYIDAANLLENYINEKVKQIKNK